MVLPNLEEHNIYFFRFPHSVSIALKLLPCQGCQRPPMTTHLSASYAASYQHPAHFTLPLHETHPLLSSETHIVQIFILPSGSFANFSAYPLSGGILYVCVCLIEV